MNFKQNLIILTTIFMIFTSCSYQSYAIEEPISYWGYQLQGVDIDTLKESVFDLLVIDYASDGTNDTTWSQSDLESLKSRGKVVISYISIGEAENYRYYWQDDWLSNPPSFLDEENPDWEGNFKVKYWDENWQSIIFDYLDIIVNQGFNGVYLDIIDAYSYYEDKNVDNAADLMISFVSNIKSHINNQNFLIIPQNGEGLLEFENYRELISGIGIEDLYYYSDDEKVDPQLTSTRESYLDLLINDNKFVLTVDYVQKTNLQQEVYQRSRDKGYIPYTTKVDLNMYVAPLLISTSQPSSTSFDVSFIELSSILIILTISNKKYFRK